MPSYGCTRRCRVALAASFGRSVARIQFVIATVFMGLCWAAERRRTRPLCQKTCEGARYGAAYQASRSDFRSDRPPTVVTTVPLHYSWSLFRNGPNCWILISVILFRFSILLSSTIYPIKVEIISVHSEDLQQESCPCLAGFARSYTHFAKFVGKR